MTRTPATRDDLQLLADRLKDYGADAETDVLIWWYMFASDTAKADAITKHLTASTLRRAKWAVCFYGGWEERAPYTQSVDSALWLKSHLYPGATMDVDQTHGNYDTTVYPSVGPEWGDGDHADFAVAIVQALIDVAIKHMDAAAGEGDDDGE